jgi:ATP-dependent exoDNAse (exonuclease V) alpha subunit
MLSNSQAERLARLANRLEVGRLAFIGDARQLGAVEAGKPFEVLQQSEATATIDRNVRARSDYLQAAAQAANAGRIGDAFEALRERVRETPDAMARSAVSDWLARQPGERETTLIMTSGRRLMAEVNQRVQAGLLAEGALGSRGIETIVRDRVHVTREELRHWRTYSTGMIVEVRAGPAARAIGLEAGDYRVTGIDQRTGKVRLEDERKRETELKPDKLPKRADDAIRLAEERRIALHEGEKIRWTDNDKDRGLLNADVARILGIDGTGVKIRNAQGIEMMLAHGDPMLKRLDLAYAMNTHQLQGATANQVIAVADSRETNLNTARLFLVNVTRPRDELTLYVDSAERYARAIARNAGDKTSALETIGLVQLPPREAIVKPAAPQVEPVRRNDKQPPVRERQLELGR